MKSLEDTQKEYQEALEGWKMAVFNTIQTAEQTRKLLDMAADNLKLFFQELKRFEKRMESARGQNDL